MLFGKDKHLILMVASLLIAASVSGQAGRNYKYHFDGNLHMGNVIAGDQNIIINYSISELNIESLNNSFGDFYKISIPGHNSSSDPGKPEIPVLSRLIFIPENSTIDIKISDVVTRKISPSEMNFKGLLYPRQFSETKDPQRQKPGFVIDKSLYSKREFLNSDTVNVELLGKVRNRQLATLSISPVRYNPSANELEVIVSMKVEVTFIPLKDNISGSSKGESVLFNQSLEKGVLNYTLNDVITGYSDQPVRMIILTDTAFKKDLKPFIKWKTQKGFKIRTLYKGTGFAGNTYTQLKDTLTKIYKAGTADDPAPEYLLIVGNVNKIPKSEGTDNTSDMYYGEFDGAGDYIPDMFIGRLPVADTSELRTVVKKIIQYEKFQFADTNRFYTRALVTAGNDPDYANYMNGQVKYAINYYLNSLNKINESHFYYPQSASTITIDSIKKLINKGVSFLNYTGHGNSDGWLYNTDGSAYYLKVPDVDLLVNKNMYPFIISNACRTALFSSSSSFGNRMVVSKDKGAIGYIGCSNDSYWDEDYYWAVGVGSPGTDPKYEETGLGAFDRLFHTHNESPSDWFVTMGQVNYAGNLAVSGSTSIWKKYYWETYTLLGDPSVIPIVGKPDIFKIAIPDTLPNGIKSLSLTINPFAYIAVSHFDTLWDASYASPSGSVVLNLPGLSNDSCLIVVTGQNKVPLIKTVRFAEVNKEYINLTSSKINDATANNNGLVDYGESFSLNLTISNLGKTDASQLYAKISSTSQYITINNDSVNIGPLAGKSEIMLQNHFGITVSDFAADKSYITLNLLLKDSKMEKRYNIDICIHAPVLEILNCLIDDSVTGNANFLADPGETLKLVFKIANSGSSSIAGMFNITNSPPGVTINETNVFTGSINYGAVKVIPITVKLASSLLRGSTFNINTLLNCAPYIKSKSFSIPVGKTRESFEYQNFTVFPWVNSKTYPWKITNEKAYEGQFSAHSGQIPNSSESLLKMSVNIPSTDTLRFQVRVSSESNYDYLYFKLNNTQIFKISGETDWLSKKIALNEGFNLLEWLYKKDEYISRGADCAWLDYLIFPALSFNKTDLKTGKIVTPQPNKNYKQEQITAQVINFGTDTVKSFNLAYTVNQYYQVYEHFNKTINPGDTGVVTFSQIADLSTDGTYLIKVYGLNNNDNYLFNDTTSLLLVNTGIFSTIENPDNRVRIAPNPFTQSFRLIIDANNDNNIRISIFESSGRILWEESRDLVPGENTLLITPDGLPPGFYTIRISGKTILKAARIVKTE